MIPTVIFNLPSLENEVKTFHHLLSRGTTRKLFEVYPELEKPSKPYYLDEFVSEIFGDRYLELQDNLEKFEKLWKEIEHDCFLTMEEITGTNWPKNRPQIKAFLSLFPWNPRFLSSWSFNLFYRTSPRRAMEIIAHECFHFLYFKKWKDIFPNANPETFERPHDAWHLSEIAVTIVLNDPRMQKFIRMGAIFYPEYLQMTVNGEPAPQFFTKLYQKYCGNGNKNGFHPFLIASAKAIKTRKAVG